MSAFDWSPGGCCCGSGWFDIFLNNGINTQSNPKGVVQRFGTLRQAGMPATAGSDDPNWGFGWYIPWYTTTLVPNAYTTICGYPSFGTAYWAFEQRTPSVFAVLYDAAAKTQLFAVDMGQFFNGPVLTTLPISQVGGANGVFAIGGASQTQFLHYQQGSGFALDGLYIVKDGTLTFTASHGYSSTVLIHESWPGYSYFPDNIPGVTEIDYGPFPYTITRTNKVDCVAWQDAPIGAGSETVRYTLDHDVGITSAPFPAITVTQESNLYIGTLSVDQNGILNVARNNVYSSHDQVRIGFYSTDGSTTYYGDPLHEHLYRRYEDPYTTYSWLAMDHSPTQWVGIIYRQTTGYNTGSLEVPPVNAIQLVINGHRVKEYIIPLGMSFATQADMLGYFFGTPHCCHPHETLGDGWIAVPEKIYTTAPFDIPTGNGGFGGANYDPGTLADPNNPWKVIIYKDGGEAWRTPAIWNSLAPRVAQSSDRWLYIPDEAIYQGSVPANIQNPTPNDHFSHDGTYQWRGGNLNAAGTDVVKVANIRLDMFHPGPWILGGSTAVVRNSAAIGNSLPAVFPPPH